LLKAGLCDNVYFLQASGNFSGGVPFKKVETTPESRYYNGKFIETGVGTASQLKAAFG
jgi:hypothetical protein